MIETPRIPADIIRATQRPIRSWSVETRQNRRCTVTINGRKHHVRPRDLALVKEHIRRASLQHCAESLSRSVAPMVACLLSDPDVGFFR
jgi:hypothetical protein